jgi:amidohydrolase
MTDLAAKSVSKIVGEENVYELKEPNMGGEDFAYLAQRVPSSFFFVGIAKDENNPISHHHPKFAWDDKNVAIVAESLAQVAIDFLNN